MLFEGGEVVHLPFVAAGLNIPDLLSRCQYILLYYSFPPGCMHTRTWQSPPAVANLPLPCGSKWAE